MHLSGHYSVQGQCMTHTHTHTHKYIEGNTIDNIGSVTHTFNSHTYTQTNMIVFDTHTHTNFTN